MPSQGQAAAPSAPVVVESETRIEPKIVNVEVDKRGFMQFILDAIKSEKSRYRQGAGDGFVDEWN